MSTTDPPPEFKVQATKLQGALVLLIPLLLILVSAPMYSADPDSGQEASETESPKPTSQIAKWILQLDNDEFKVREQAEHALTRAGLKSLPAVLKATQSKQAEVRMRAFAVLFAQSKSDDQDLVNSVLTAAEEILQSHARLRVSQAKRILAYRKVHDRQILLKLGARFEKPRRIHLFGPSVTDEHMVHLKYLTETQLLALENTLVTDAGLEPLKGLTILQALSLSNAQITDAGLEYLKEMTALQELNLADSNINGAGLKHMKGLTKLTYLNLSRTKVTDTGLRHLKEISSVEDLLLFRTNITDAGLSHLKGMSNLNFLNLGKTRVTDAGLEYLKKLTGLQALNLVGTNVTAEGVENLQQALPNCKIRH
jgi:hypothetical protein